MGFVCVCVCVCVCERERERERERDRQTDRQTDRQIDRQTDRDKDRERDLDRSGARQERADPTGFRATGCCREMRGTKCTRLGFVLEPLVNVITCP